MKTVKQSKPKTTQNGLTKDAPKGGPHALANPRLAEPRQIKIVDPRDRPMEVLD